MDAIVSKGCRPYKVIPIRLFGTNKTTAENTADKPLGRRNVHSGNCLDPFRGCSSFADRENPRCPWDCYSEEAVRRFLVEFGIPMRMELKEHRLRRDLQKLRKNGTDWVRIGVNGEPLHDGGRLCADVVEIVDQEGLIPVVITRLWRPLLEEYLEKMVHHNTIFNITVSAADDPEWIARRQFAFWKMREVGAMVSMRVVTFAFKSSDRQRWIFQDLLMNMPNRIEQPARIMRRTKNTKRKVCAWDWIDKDRYHPYHSYVSGKINKRWLTAGQLYEGFACVKDCPSCENKCMAAVFIPEMFLYEFDLILNQAKREAKVLNTSEVINFQAKK